jgi:hypothetical protein
VSSPRREWGRGAATAGRGAASSAAGAGAPHAACPGPPVLPVLPLDPAPRPVPVLSATPASVLPMPVLPVLVPPVLSVLLVPPVDIGVGLLTLIAVL